MLRILMLCAALSLGPGLVLAVVPSEGGGGESAAILKARLQERRQYLAGAVKGLASARTQEATLIARQDALRDRIKNEANPARRKAYQQQLDAISPGAIQTTINSLQALMSETTAQIEDLERQLAAPEPAGGGTSGGAGTGERSGDASTPPRTDAPAPPADFLKIIETIYKITEDKKQRAIYAIHQDKHKGWRNGKKPLTLPVRVANAVTAYVAQTGDRLGFVSRQLLEARNSPESLKGKTATVRRASVGVRVRPFQAWKGVAGPKSALAFTGKYTAGWFEVILDGKLKGWVPIIWLRGPGAAPEPGDDDSQEGEPADPADSAGRGPVIE